MFPGDTPPTTGLCHQWSVIHHVTVKSTGYRKCIPKATATTQQRKLLSPDCKHDARGSVSGSPENKAPRAPLSPGAVGRVPASGTASLRPHPLAAGTAAGSEASAASPEDPSEAWLAGNPVTKRSGPYLPRRKRKKTGRQEGKIARRRVLCFKRGHS